MVGQFCTLISVLNVHLSKILHLALLHLGSWALGWHDLGIYLSLLSCLFNGAHFSTLRSVLHVQVSKILQLAMCTFGPWPLGGLT